MRVLILVAHPDDEVIMAGATISKLVSKKHEVCVGFCTKNEEAYFGDESQKTRIKRTVEEAHKSSEILGFSLSFLPFQDMHLQANKGKLLKATIKQIRKLKPNILITHHSQDKHIDHRTLGEVVPEANFQSGCKLCGGKVVWTTPLVLQGEVNLEARNDRFDFDVVSKVKKSNFGKKIQAFACYSSIKDEHQTKKEILFEKLRMRAVQRGAAIGKQYGEAFALNNYVIPDENALRLLADFLEE